MNKNASSGVFIHIGRHILMKNKLLIFIILVSACLFGKAETISQKQAQQLAHLFFNEAAGKVTAPPKLVYNGRRLTTGRLFNPFYVYNTSLGGFVIISAENKAYPILGFSLKDSFDPEKLGEAEKALLTSYAMEIEMVRYDTQPVEGAIKAWGDYGTYVHNILTSRYIATDPVISVEEAYKAIDNAMERDEAIYSDIYTPSQWREMITDEVNLKLSAPVAFFMNRDIYPGVVYGYQGDYFRIEMSQRNSWLMRLNATEVIPSNMVSVVFNPIQLPLEFDEEIPFADHDLFLAEVEDIETKRNEKSSIDIPMIEDEPFIKANGGGSFEIFLPENITMARVYNLAGALLRQSTYNDTQKAFIDLSSEPSGFYFVNIIGESGRPYGLKLYR